jgi:peptidoglycan-associated lipoprotein
LQDVYFDYDSSNLREDARQSLSRTSVALKAITVDFPEDVIVIEGHCDERGASRFAASLAREAQTLRRRDFDD